MRIERILGKKGCRICAFLALLILFLPTLWGEEEPDSSISLDLQVPIFLKIMTYDRSFNLGNGEVFRVGFIARAEGMNTGSFLEVQKILADKTILGHPIVLSPISLEALEKEVETVNPHILILSRIPDEHLAKVLHLSKARRIMTFGTDPDYLKVDIGVVLTLEAGKPLINLNLDVAKDAGADFPSNFLKHCRIIR